LEVSCHDIVLVGQSAIAEHGTGIIHAITACQPRVVLQSGALCVFAVYFPDEGFGKVIQCIHGGNDGVVSGNEETSKTAA